jgi:hypothetical protein
LHIYAKIGVDITKYDMDLTNNIVISVAKLTQRYSIHDFFLSDYHIARSNFLEN